MEVKKNVSYRLCACGQSQAVPGVLGHSSTDCFHMLSIILLIVIANLFKHFVDAALAQSSLLIIRLRPK